jgi:hypothetical protein
VVTLSTQGRTAFAILIVNVPSAAVVALPLPDAHLACTVAFSSAAPTAAVPLIDVVVTVGVADGAPSPPPQAESTAAVKPVKRSLDFIPVISLC